jgi:gamma-glutamyltranspeptidase / glutathione hydrolase
VDAVVAMIFAGAVNEGTLTSLGGGGFILVAGGDEAPTVLDCFARRPGLGEDPDKTRAPWEEYALELDGATLRFGTGPASVAVPALPAGLARASERWGAIPLSKAAEPAATLAQRGVTLTVAQANEHAANVELMQRDPQAAQIYGKPARKAGDVFQQPALAAAIEEIAATKAESFYRGAIADRIVEWSERRGARITRDDLRSCEAVERPALIEKLGDVTMATTPRPSLGGGIIARLLPALVPARAQASGADLAVARSLVATLREIKPPVTRAPVEDEIDGGPGTPDVADADPSAVRTVASPNTTHVSAIDSNGLLCAATTTVGYGSGEFVPGAGIQLNNMLAEYDNRYGGQAGETVPSMMAPSVLVGERTTVALGSAGSDRIPQAISQILARMWCGMDLEGAVAAPRFVWDGSSLHAEAGFDPDAITQLHEQYGVVTEWPGHDAYFGTSNGASWSATGLHAVGDPRREGTGFVIEL